MRKIRVVATLVGCAVVGAAAAVLFGPRPANPVVQYVSPGPEGFERELLPRLRAV